MFEEYVEDLGRSAAKIEDKLRELRSMEDLRERKALLNDVEEEIEIVEDQV